MSFQAKCLLVLLLVVLSGCSVRQVYRDSTGGVLALPMNTNAWPLNYRDRANQIMQRQFPNGYIVTHEGEEIVGQTTIYDEQYDGGLGFFDGLISIGPDNVWGSSMTMNETEYRIHYRGR